MPHRLKEAIITSAADVAGISGSRIAATMNMVADYGVQPTASEASTLVRAAEEYLRTVRGVMQGWVARIPGVEGDTTPSRRKEDEIRAALDLIAPPEDPTGPGSQGPES